MCMQNIFHSDNNEMKNIIYLIIENIKKYNKTKKNYLKKFEFNISLQFQFNH